jgi:DNA invertase Pin-like site-specific DNA recombinase
MTPAAAYERCSGKASLFGDTWERQITAIRECARSQGYEVLYEFQEKAVPGKTDADERPAFQEMIATLLENGCRTIIVESLDRLAREYRIQEQLIIYIASKGLTLISANTGENVTEAMMGDPMRRALVQIQGILAELDKNMIVAKLRKARERKRKAGARCEGRRPYGSRPGEQLGLSTMQRLAGLGFDATEIAKVLDADGYKSRYGKTWNAGTVWKILQRNRGVVPS